jgi:hypothetical protein
VKPSNLDSVKTSHSPASAGVFCVDNFLSRVIGVLYTTCVSNMRMESFSTLICASFDAISPFRKAFNWSLCHGESGEGTGLQLTAISTAG